MPSDCDMRLASSLRVQQLTAARLTVRTVHVLCDQWEPSLNPSSLTCLGEGRLVWALFCAKASDLGCCHLGAIAEGPGAGLCHEAGEQRSESPGR